MDRLKHDVRIAIRGLRRAPVFTFTVVVILGIGIGMSSTMATVYQSILRERLPVADQARLMLAAFPEATVVTSQVGRPDDGTDTTGFFNTEYFVDLKPKEQWRSVFIKTKSGSSSR